jgi:hypothetical protein
MSIFCCRAVLRFIGLVSFDKVGQGKAAELMETRVVIFVRQQAPSTEYSLDFGGEQDRAAGPWSLRRVGFWESPAPSHISSPLLEKAGKTV